MRKIRQREAKLLYHPAIDLTKEAPELRVPYILLEGRHDYNSVSSLAADYFNAIKAPVKKVFWSEKSAYWPVR